ncbi:MAG: hypothetical protein ACRDWG_11565 [Actinomycetes bacterium]
MQYDDQANRTTDPDVDDTDATVPQPDREQSADSDYGNEALAEYPVVEESVVEAPDEQAAATDPRGGSDRGGSDEAWQGVQPVDGTEAVSEDPVAEDIADNTHPTNVQPVTPDLGGVQPVDPDLGTGESVDDSSGTDTPEDPELAAAGLDETDTEGSGPGTVRTNPDIDRTDATVDRKDADIDPSDAATAGAVGGTAAAAGTTQTAARTDNDDPLRARWHEAQHLFVDDPAKAVHEAAALVQAAAEQASSATHEGSGTESGSDTEWLRITMQRYHEAFELLIGISSGDVA